MISVVIPAYNEEKTIALCLDSLVGQKTNKQFEVIVVNNNSTDRTEDVVKKYQDKLKSRIILEKKKGRGAARAAGFQAAQGEIIFSTDADTIVPEDWLEKILSFLQEKDMVAVTGPAKINDCSWLTNKLFNFFQPRAMILYRVVFGQFWLSGFNFAVRKTAYLKSGGFNPRFDEVEDIDLGFKVNKVGKIKFVRDFPVLFSGRRFREGLIRGSLPYFKTFINHFFLKKRDVKLKDVR